MCATPYSLNKPWNFPGPASETNSSSSPALLQPNYKSIISSCNIWRNFDDIQDSWQSVASVIDYYGDNQDTIIPNAGPGHWNDPDMVGARKDSKEDSLLSSLLCILYKVVHQIEVVKC